MANEANVISYCLNAPSQKTRLEEDAAYSSETFEASAASFGRRPPG